MLLISSTTNKRRQRSLQSISSETSSSVWYDGIQSWKSIQLATRTQSSCRSPQRRSFLSMGWWWRALNSELFSAFIYAIFFSCLLLTRNVDDDVRAIAELSPLKKIKYRRNWKHMPRVRWWWKSYTFLFHVWLFHWRTVQSLVCCQHQIFRLRSW